jgi:16S rRNA (guanine527-N7)-methyltransferase
MQREPANAMTSEEQLRRGLTALDLALDDNQIARLLEYCALLQKWNRVYNLTAIREPSRFVSHHLLDSLAVLPYLNGKRLIDVGTGAGLPGIPLAVARPDWEVMLLDSNHKKAAFLRQAALELGVQNAQIEIARAEEWRPTAPYAIAISRAFADITGFIEAARQLILPDGIFAAMKGVYPHEELSQLPADVEVTSVNALSVPGMSAARHLVLLRFRGSH